ncbi:MAG: hypothetical protein AAFV54_14260, partial [Pseudomonadota bacterium]
FLRPGRFTFERTKKNLSALYEKHLVFSNKIISMFFWWGTFRDSEGTIESVTQFASRHLSPIVQIDRERQEGW